MGDLPKVEQQRMIPTVKRPPAIHRKGGHHRLVIDLAPVHLCIRIINLPPVHIFKHDLVDADVSRVVDATEYDGEVPTRLQLVVNANVRFEG